MRLCQDTRSFPYELAFGRRSESSSFRRIQDYSCRQPYPAAFSDCAPWRDLPEVNRLREPGPVRTRIVRCASSRSRLLQAFARHMLNPRGGGDMGATSASIRVFVRFATSECPEQFPGSGESVECSYREHTPPCEPNAAQTALLGYREAEGRWMIVSFP